MKRMNGLKLKIPPPIVAIALMAVMWLAARLTPALLVPIPAHRALAGVIFLSAVMISLSGVIAFRRARTTVNPMKPETASSLVVVGIYRFTRNPMYLGLSMALLAWAVYLSNPLTLVFLPAFILYMNQFQIAPEEAALDARFGESFTAYKSRVRRWV
jgi:protein-S-isoprenylcysteine O-methyltransferase Ste14